METVFYVLFRSQNQLHDRMEYFTQQKTLNDYMIWQNIKRTECESKYGDVVVENFDIKFSMVNSVPQGLSPTFHGYVH